MCVCVRSNCYYVAIVATCFQLLITAEETGLSISQDSNSVKEEINSEQKLGVSELVDIFNVSKQISHSKGPYSVSKDGEVDYRRSIYRKVSFQTESNLIKNLLQNLKSNNSTILEDLENLEYYVHNYDSAIEFMNMGGIELIINLTKFEDSDISTTAFLVLTAAMQGNPSVQKYFKETHFIHHVLSNSNNWKGASRSAILAMISSFLRNAPECQNDFFDADGIVILSSLLENTSYARNQKLKIITLYSDLAAEFYMNPEIENDPKRSVLIEKFEKGIVNSSTCSTIVLFLENDDFYVLEKVVPAVKSLSFVCKADFQKSTVLYRIKILILLYKSNDMHIDDDLKSIMHKDLIELFDILATDSLQKNISVDNSLKIEL